MKKQTFLLLVGLLFACNVMAQTEDTKPTEKKKKEYKEFKNTLRFAGSAHYFSNTWSPLSKQLSPENVLDYPTEQLADQLGVYLERRLYRNFGVGVGYVEWNGFDPFGSGVISGLRQTVSVKGNYYPKRGDLLRRYEYKLFDLLLTYRYNRFKQHKIDVCAGPTYQYGINELYGISYGHVLENYAEHGQYYGIAAGISYDYLILKNRVAIGNSFKCRKYVGLVGAQLDFGFHVGINF